MQITVKSNIFYVTYTVEKFSSCQCELSEWSCMLEIDVSFENDFIHVLRNKGKIVI